MRIAESESLAAVFSTDWGSKDLDQITKTRISYFIAALLHDANNNYQHCKMGILTEKQALASVYGLKSGIMDNPTARSIWAINKRNFDAEFCDQFESIIYPEGFDTRSSDSHLWKIDEP